MVMIENPTMNHNPKRIVLIKDRGSFLNVAQFLGGVASDGYTFIILITNIVI